MRTMEGGNWALSLLCSSFLLATLSESCLDGTIDRLVSESIYSILDPFFEASSVHEGYPPQQAKLEGRSWCSSDSLTPLERPWLQVTFKIDVNISIIQTGGYDGFLKDNYYITRFEVCVGDGMGNLHPLTSDNSEQPMVFSRKGTYRVENTVLPSPVTARVLRIVAVGWDPQDQVCLRLEALGCPILSAPTTVPTTTTEPNTEATLNTTQGIATTEETSEASSYSTEETTPTEGTSETSQESILVLPPGQSRTLMVGGAVGGALSVVVALLLLVIVLGAIFIFTRRRRPVQLPASCEVDSEHRLDKTTYKATPLQSPCKDISEHKVDNSKYGEGEIKGENHLSMRDHPSSILSNIYESIAAPNTILHEPIQDLNEIVNTQDEGMHDNPLYDTSSEENFKMEHNLTKPSISSCSTLDTYEPTVLHEPIMPDFSGSIDLQDEELTDNPLYDKSNEDLCKIDSQDEAMYDNPLYDKSNEDLGKIDSQDEEMYDNHLYDKSNDDVFKMDPQDEGMHDNKNSEKYLRMEYQQTGPGLSAFNTSESTPTTTTLLYEPIEVFNGTMDLHD